eukprot:TRINITY_DN3896_c0_g1_i1.p1 TRINITY_DN3896_c0_g1~~TRINITY_DN3896_c0_g1_i1.p1  ORF type:complete len:706 (+),score=120.61 TRINITY_DN3896_c0_g1_i1:66-2183(+)
MAAIPAPPTKALPQGGARRPSRGNIPRMTPSEHVMQVRKTICMQEEERTEFERKADQRQIEETKAIHKKSSFARSVTQNIRDISEVDDEDEDQKENLEDEEEDEEDEEEDDDDGQASAAAAALKVSHHALLPQLPSDITAAEEVSAAKNALDLISFGPDGRKAAPALKLVRNALISYHGAANSRLQDMASRKSYHRARRRPPPTPLLSQAMPIPFKRQNWRSRSTSAGSSLPARGATSSSMGGASPVLDDGRPNTSGVLDARSAHLQPVTLPRRPGTSAQVGDSSLGRMSPPTTETDRPNTSGGINRRLYSHAVNLPTRPEASAQVGDDFGGRVTPSAAERSTSSASASSGAASPDGESGPRTRHSTALQKIPAKLKPIHRLYTLGGRLSKKAFSIKTSRLIACDLAVSCRKRSRAVERMMRREEHSIAAVQANTRTYDKEKPVSRDTGGLKGYRRGKTKESDLSSPAAEDKHEARSANSGSAEPAQVGELTVFDAFDLAQSLNLPAGQVTQAWKLFKRYDKDNDGLLAPYDFQLLLRAVLRERFPSAREVPRELFREALEIQSTSMAVTFNDFLTWITQNSFTEDLLLSDDERFVRRIARRFNVPLLEVEKVKGHFDSFDTDGSGHIEECEFNMLLGKLLNLTDTDALPQSRIKSFWRELDDDNSGSVEFHEFIPWYLGYFGGYGASPLINFYRRVRPVPFHDD